MGLDYIPTAWGGNGFEEGAISTIEVVIPSNNYSFQHNDYLYDSLTINNGKINNLELKKVIEKNEYDNELLKNIFITSL